LNLALAFYDGMDVLLRVSLHYLLCIDRSLSLATLFRPAISPDGGFVAYVTEQPGGESMLMRQAISGGPSLEFFHAKGICIWHTTLGHFRFPK
jgi:hypothetical protein